MRPAPSYSRSVRRVSIHGRRPPRVYYRWLLVILALTVSAARPPVAGAQVELTVSAAMVKGPADAPVTIIEFSDYQ